MCVTHPLLQGTTYPVRNCCCECHLVHDVCHASTLKWIILLSYNLLPSTSLSPRRVSRIHCHQVHFTQKHTVAVDAVESMMCVTHPLSKVSSFSVTNCCRRRRWVHDVCHASTVTKNIFLGFKLLPSTSLSPRCVSRIHCHKEHFTQL